MKTYFSPVCLEKAIMVPVAVSTVFREPDSRCPQWLTEWQWHDLLSGVSIKIMESDSGPGTTA